MPSARIPDTVRRVFTEAFSARDIAEPLASFDAEASAAGVTTAGLPWNFQGTRGPRCLPPNHT
jgi:hypothetical protein